MSISNQRRLLPSTSMLAAFEAAFRCCSFTSAAHELNLSQGAISKQVGALESILGVELFHRGHQAITQTEAGKSYYKAIQPALDSIRSASLRIMTRPHSGTLSLAVLPTFGTRWLMPRLPSFLADHPHITLHFSSKLTRFDFQAESLDAAIHCGSDDWPNAENLYLMGEEVIPVCSPDFMSAHGISSVDEMCSAPLLHITSRPNAWPDWFLAQGLTQQSNEGMYFEQFTTAAQASIAGLGIALLPEFLVINELQRNELVKVVNLPMKSHHAYYLVTPFTNANHGPLRVFRKWLLEQSDLSRSTQAE